MSLSAGAPSHPPFTYSTSTPHVSTAATHGQAFPLPRYLEYSALRDLLHPDDTPAVTPAAVRSTAAASLSRVQSHAPVRPIPIPYPYLRSSLTPVDSESEGNTPSPSPPPRRGTSVPVTIAPAPSTSGLRIPTRWGEQSKSSQLTLSADGCELTFCGASLADRDTAASARTACPIPRACGIYYFEVEILERGAKGKSVSIGFSTEKLRMSRMPGWEPYSWAYYGDDGRVYSGQKEAYTFVEEFQSGDVIGCGIDFSQNRAFYTKNGTFLGMFFEGLPADDLYPAIGLRHPHESIRVNFGSVPFHYAIADHARTQRDTIWEHIMHGPAEDEAGDRESGVEGAATRATLQRLVMSYLSHHGYVSTLRNFRTQCADESSRHSVDERGPDPTDPESPDFQRRVAILHAVREGNIDVALDGLRAYYPHALGAQSGLLLFRLRCRKFVELVLKASEALRRVKDVEKAQGGSGAASEAVMASDEDVYATGKGEDADGEGAMDTAKAALHLTLSYGQELEAEYKTDARPEIRVHLRRTFGMVAYDDPEHEDGEMGAMAGQEARVELTGEVNQAILESQGRPVHSSLETLFRQTGACVVQLGVLGVGAAAYADVRQEFLET
ncbi:hypothetical protein POSPLADRAFT_1130698 [Postia placenta MAD-698-R-SB12]|uniref:B30.2/SPRY domain-containing protein n=1 Tax=Postia placenta MAD-698-R-SB12 TaxID=670580 RepID=A0A1X6NIA7_9APHY|nr:hypothetical protein POSPLADRAFT_1130698 [Postia placenta MAD-698-R-SB12]OSX68093.1 hypothetical protein POSPLADRAFT_1130698 [Postia placenta MAD-698-R-SB12]